MYSTIFFSLVINIFQVTNTNQKQILYRCGFNDEKVIPKPINNYIPIKEDKRKLNGDNFKDFNIYLDLINIKNDIKKYKLEKYEELFISSLTKGVETLKSLLKVKKKYALYKFSDEQIYNMGIEHWNETLIGSKVNIETNKEASEIDLFIFGKFSNEMDETTLASAGARYTTSGTGQPLVGIININTKADYSRINSQKFFQSIVLHEFTHILGFSSEHFQIYIHNIFTRQDKYGLYRYYINSPKVIEVAKKYYNCSSIDGVELENDMGQGTAGSHWEARTLLGEYMIGVVYPEEQVISEFTLALLEDTGYYKANYYTGGLMRYGKNKGCDFIYNNCVDSNHQVNPLFENEFYDSISSPAFIDSSCSSGRQSRTYYAWWIYDDIPSQYQYFSNKKYGGFVAADFCPVSREIKEENDNSYYIGHCSLKGSGQYGTKIKYRGSRNYYYYTSNEAKSYTGETLSDHSFCYQSTLVKNGINFNTNVVRAVCFESFCSSKSLTIKVNNDYFVCPRAGGKIKLVGYKGYFMCPDYYLICSGTVMCNDMFDCLDKKSETKEESYNYDYTIQTTQNIESIEISSFDDTNNYELTKNGICPINCKQCNLNNICKNCRNNYGLIYSKENNEITCEELSKLTKGYYKLNNIYYNCIERCNVCKNNITCDECIEGYAFGNKKCLVEIKNCKIYGTDDLCDECKYNYVISENNRNLCKKVNSFFILQIQIINNELKIFFIASESMEEKINIKLNISLYKTNKTNIRNMEEDTDYLTKEVNLKLDSDSSIQEGEINSFTSEEKFDDNDRVILDKNLEENSLYEIKTLNNNDKILDTEENKKMIENGTTMDFSDITSSESKIKTYTIKSISQGCEFNLISDSQIQENNQNINLNFIENDNSNNNISINCILSKDNNYNIPCHLDPEINNKYFLESFIGSDKEGMFYYINPEKDDSFQLICQNKKEEEKEEKNDKSKTKLIIIICAIGAAFIIIITIIIICCKKKKPVKVNYNEKKIRPHNAVPYEDNMDISFSNPTEK